MSRPSQIRFLSRAARLYDPVVRGMGFPDLWERIAAIASPPEEGVCLDVCTGTGGLALAMARRGAYVVGLDAAPGMLRRARRKARQAGLESHVKFMPMDARSLALPDDSFPVVTCCMALHEMSEGERDQVLRELRRVASQRVVVADYRVPRGARGWLFRALHVYEYLESDDFGSYASSDPAQRLAEAGLEVDPPSDAGAFRIWPCRVATAGPAGARGHGAGTREGTSGTQPRTQEVRRSAATRRQCRRLQSASKQGFLSIGYGVDASSIEKST